MAGELDITLPHLHAFRVRVRTYAPQFFKGIWLILLGSPLQALLDANPSRQKLWLALAGLALFVATYIGHLIYFPLESGRARTSRGTKVWATVITLTALSAVMTIGLGPPFLVLFVFAGVTVGTCLPTTYAPKVLGAVIAFATLCGIFAGSSWSNVAGYDLTIFGIGSLIILLSHLATTVRDLRSARMEIARLAVSEERLRFSRDLHDLLGHSLSLITLKSELAGRLIESSPEKAALEIHDIERIARSALQETREAVAGYRQPTLTRELAAAREMLSAAGISFVSSDAGVTLPLDIESVLAWTVREGVTNVIRHSRATQCTIKVATNGGSVGIEVIDNGAAPRNTESYGGNGLKGLTERVKAHSGMIEAQSRPEGGFRLTVTLPFTQLASIDDDQLLARSA